jgi:hypothetical protein
MTTAGPPGIEVTGLRKSYGDHTVLDDLDLRVAEGAIFALLGAARPRRAGRGGYAGRAQTARPGGHIRVQLSDAASLDAGELACAGSIRDDDALALQIPSDGDVRSLRTMLDQLDAAGVDAGAVTVHTPDLDDVFLALTGHTTEQSDTARQKETVR